MLALLSSFCCYLYASNASYMACVGVGQCIEVELALGWPEWPSGADADGGLQFCCSVLHFWDTCERTSPRLSDLISFSDTETKFNPATQWA